MKSYSIHEYRYRRRRFSMSVFLHYPLLICVLCVNICSNIMSIFYLFTNKTSIF